MTVSPSALDELRIQIDAIDSQMVELLAQRSKLTAHDVYKHRNVVFRRCWWKTYYGALCASHITPKM